MNEFNHSWSNGIGCCLFSVHDFFFKRKLSNIPFWNFVTKFSKSRVKFTNNFRISCDEENMTRDKATWNVAMLIMVEIYWLFFFFSKKKMSKILPILLTTLREPFCLIFSMWSTNLDNLNSISMLVTKHGSIPLYISWVFITLWNLWNVKFSSEAEGMLPVQETPYSSENLIIFYAYQICISFSICVWNMIHKIWNF